MCERERERETGRKKASERAREKERDYVCVYLSDVCVYAFVCV